jgi:hypothetical protein
MIFSMFFPMPVAAALAGADLLPGGLDLPKPKKTRQKT